MRELAKMEKEEREAKIRSDSREKSKSPARAKSRSPPRPTATAEALLSRIEKQRAMLAAVSAKYQQEESPVKPKKEKGRAKSSPSKIRNSEQMSPVNVADSMDQAFVASAPVLRKRGRPESHPAPKHDGFLDDLVSAKQELRSQIAGLLEQQNLQRRELSPSRVTFQEGSFTVARNRSPGGAATPTKSAPGSANKERRPVWVDTSSSVSGVFPSLQEIKRRIMSDPSNKVVKKEDTVDEQRGKAATPKKKKSSGKVLKRNVKGKKPEGLSKKRMQRAKRLVKNAATAYVGPEVEVVMDQLGFKHVEDLLPEEEQPETTHSPSVRRRPIKKASEGELIISRKQYIESKKSKDSPTKQKTPTKKTPTKTGAQPALTGILKKPTSVTPSKKEAGASPLRGPVVNNDDDDHFYSNDFEDNDENTGKNSIAESIAKKKTPIHPSARVDKSLSADDESEYNQEEFEIEDDGVEPKFFLTAQLTGADVGGESTIVAGDNSQKGGMESISGSKFDFDERPSTGRLNSRGSFNASMELMGDRQFVTSRGRTPTSRGKSSRRRRRLAGTPGSPSAVASRSEVHSPMAEPPQSLGDDDGAYLDDFEAEVEHGGAVKQSVSAVSPIGPKRVTFSPITKKEKVPLELGTPSEAKVQEPLDEVSDVPMLSSFKELRPLPDTGVDVAAHLDPKERASMNAFVSSLFELKDGEKDLDLYGEEEEVDFDAGASRADGASSSILASLTSFVDSDDDVPRAPQRRVPKDRSVFLPRGVAIAQLAFANRDELVNPNKVFKVGVTTRSKAVLPRIASEVRGYPSQLDLRIMRASGELATKRKEKVVEQKDEFAEKIKEFAKKNQTTSSIGAAGGKFVKKR
jgi:hypothetical protein